jgi:hypothetical protein
VAIVRRVGSGSGGGSTTAVMVFADDPPSTLTAMAFDNVTDDAPALQAMLNYVSAAGGGDVVVSKPGATYKILSGITIPNGVRYIGPGKRNGRGTLCNASSITSGAAFTVATTQDATPITGLWMDGGMFAPTYTNLTSTYTGISITGVGLTFADCHLQYFGRGVDLAHSGTFGIVFERSTITRCANGWWGTSKRRRRRRRVSATSTTAGRSRTAYVVSAPPPADTIADLPVRWTSTRSPAA